MNKAVKSVLIIASIALAGVAHAQATGRAVALPGSVDNWANFIETLLKAKWVIAVGAVMMVAAGFQVWEGKMTLVRFKQIAIALGLIFGAVPIAYSLYSALS